MWVSDSCLFQWRLTVCLSGDYCPFLKDLSKDGRRPVYWLSCLKDGGAWMTALSFKGQQLEFPCNSMAIFCCCCGLFVSTSSSSFLLCCPQVWIEGTDFFCNSIPSSWLFVFSQSTWHCRFETKATVVCEVQERCLMVLQRQLPCTSKIRIWRDWRRSGHCLSAMDKLQPSFSGILLRHSSS